MKSLSKSSVSLVVSVLALILAGVWTQPFAHVGESATFLMHKLGIDPLAPFAHPVYGWIVSLIALVTGSHAVYAVNLFSAVCAAGVLWLVFQFVYRFTESINSDREVPSDTMHLIQLGAATVASLYLLASAPFMLAATRAHPLMFDLLLLLGAFYLVAMYVSGQPVSRLIAASVLYGVNMVEFSTAILLLPFFSVLLLVRMWQAGVLTTRHVAASVLAGLAGLSVYLVQAGVFMTTDIYEWREFRGFWQSVWYILVEQKQNMTGGLPRTGWLTLAMVSFLPWAVTASFRLSRGAQHKPGAMWGTLILNAILGALAVLLLLDFPLSPENVTGSFRLFVTPYLFIALWVGNVAAFWLVVWSRDRRFDRPFIRTVRRVSLRVIAPLMPAYLVFVMVTDALPKSRDPADRLIHEFARSVVDRAAEMEWIITASPVDDLVCIEAGMRKLPLKVIRMNYGKSAVYMKYVAGMLEDYPRLQSLALVGMSPLIDEWFFQIPDVQDNTLIIPIPDMWMMAGFDAVPDRVLFAGVKQGVALPLDELMARHRAYWEDYGRRVVGVEVDKNTMPGISIGWIRNHLSKVANNLGVYLEDQQRATDAYACYKQARELAPDNLSALMNMQVVAKEQGYPELADLEAELNKATENLTGRVQAWSLSHVYGFVRVPELFASRGMAFAMSGKATMAINDMQRALALSKQNPRVRLALAGLYFGQAKDSESRGQYEDVLDADPNNVRALIGLTRLAVRNNQFDEARQHLEALRKTDVPSAVVKMEEAVLESMAGSPELALKLMQEVVAEQPDNMVAWAAIAINAAQLKDKAAVDEAMARLRDAKTLGPAVQLVMAQSALEQGDRETARRHLSTILRSQPGNIPALEMSLRLDLYDGNRDLVKQSVEKILTHDPRNALANYMLGVEHYYKQEYALAESAYRVSLATERSPEALNDLAFILYLQGNYDEAEKLVRESIQLNDRNSSAWDTLGVILIERNQLEEAEQSLQRSLGLRPNVAGVSLSLAVLYEKAGRYEESLKIGNDVNARQNELSPQDQDRLQRLMNRLNDRALAR